MYEKEKRTVTPEIPSAIPAALEIVVTGREILVVHSKGHRAFLDQAQIFHPWTCAHAHITRVSTRTDFVGHPYCSLDPRAMQSFASWRFQSPSSHFRSYCAD